MIILGLSAFYHESACCLLKDGELIAAAAEERFTRVKHDPRLPVRAFRYCLQAGGNLHPGDIDCIAYYEMPEKKRQRQLWSGRSPAEEETAWLENQEPEAAIRSRLGYDGPILYFPHHLSHSASAYYFSGLEDAAVLTVDGVGEWATTTYGHGRGDDLEIFEEVRFPHSLGLLYATITSYLGFRVNSDEYKVMGLAPYGRPRFVDLLGRLVQSQPKGQFNLDMDYFDFISGSTMYSQTLVELFEHSPRIPGDPIEPFHKDVARSVQVVLEELLLEKVGYLASQSDSRNLCLAGGVALNCVANGRIRREGPFQRLFVQPAAGDAGGCLGAAALAYRKMTGRRHGKEAMSHVFLGPSFNIEDIQQLLFSSGIKAVDCYYREDAPLEAVVDRLVDNQIVGWFQGAMEFGPRALGARSILANPAAPKMRDRLNERVKKRETFRPFAPSILLEEAGEHFELAAPSPFMLETCQVRSSLPLPAVTHVDGSARPQTVDADTNPRFAALLRSFQRRTGYPVLLNTSLNIRGEPIVCTPVDALICLVRANLDALVLGDFLIDRAMLPENLDRLLAAWDVQPRFAFSDRQSAVHETLYTLV